MSDDKDGKSLIAEEIARRREALRQADASNRIEGIPHDPATEKVWLTEIQHI